MTADIQPYFWIMKTLKVHKYSPTTVDFAWHNISFGKRVMPHLNFKEVLPNEDM